MTNRHIVAIGGCGLGTRCADLPLLKYVVELAGKPHPNAAFLPTASGESHGYALAFQQTFAHLGCRTSWFSFFQPPTADLRGYFLDQDLIYVGGGNTKSMLALWREWGLDEILREAWENGTVLAGLSAGAICWFEQGITDSVPGPLTPLPCLGFLPGSCCPHYDSEPMRQPSFTRLITEGALKPGYAADDGVGLHFLGTEFHQAISPHAGKRAFYVTSESEALLPVRRLQ